MNYFSIISRDPQPLRRVRTLTDGGLHRLVQELAQVPAPNDFHAEVYAIAMHEVLLRWRQTLLSTDLEEGSTTEDTEGHGG